MSTNATKESKKRMNNVLNFYFKTTLLKNQERQNMVYADETKTRPESIADHIYGTQMLAIAIQSSYSLPINISKVLMMLALHETKEINSDTLASFNVFSEEDNSKYSNSSLNKVLNEITDSNSFINLITEFESNKTPEARFAYLCDQAENFIHEKCYFNGNTSDIYDNELYEIINIITYSVYKSLIGIDEEKFDDDLFRTLLELQGIDTSLNKESKQKISNLLNFYFNTLHLKDKERQGWVYWNVSGTRRESIAEHIYGTQMLAMAIHSAYNLPINLKKVITMLSLHETEEIKIGDITPFDNISAEEKLKIGDEAVQEVFKPICNSQEYIDLISEFNAHETAESIFAYHCDKAECDLQAKKYSDNNNCFIYGAIDAVTNDQRVQELLNNGAYSVFQVFMGIDEDKFDDPIFKNLLNFAYKYRIPVK